jgi:hypothetical protein
LYIRQFRKTDAQLRGGRKKVVRFFCYQYGHISVEPGVGKKIQYAALLVLYGILLLFLHAFVVQYLSQRYIAQP